MSSKELIYKSSENDNLLMELTDEDLDKVIASSSINEIGKWVGYETRQNTMNKNLFGV
ncbi:hypothetical protein [Inconstantimicrobium mannanitabidum]|uniref:Uncharacterized protein n=1 Tax=Inconstantimicrobium mannanitabidum TaxID=1604901 RepID=A0ACB5RIM1_9CLOT|nr:hypothetical protein [Clostridium sp. TW13]GKX68937.1 hypothetical protein rsdtw13_41950 [Clostridium sp. TW13]